MGDTWRNIRIELERTHLVTFASASGTVSERSEFTPAHRRFYDFVPAPEPLAEP